VSQTKVWVIDDDSSIRWVISKALQRAQIEVRAFESANGVIERLRREPPDVIVTDIRMPGQSGLELLDHIRECAQDIPVIVMTAYSDLDSALASYQGGAFEYLPKPFDVDEVVRLVERAVEHRPGAETIKMDSQTAPEIIGEAPAMQEVFRAIGRLSHSSINVLICGESGTGKELVARALHRHSPRSSQPFIPINTAAIPAELLESELFGHEKGAFTGAHTQRRGRFEQAHGGTLFLDEIADMPPALQTRLLRVLSDGRFYRVGGHKQIAVDVRILAATNQNLSDKVDGATFREDLFHRLNVISVNLPPLRERCQDIPALASHFLEVVAGELNVEPKELKPDAMAHLCELDWPGNVRQLENTCRWLTVMAAGQKIATAELPVDLRSRLSQTDATSDWERQLKSVIEQQLVRGEHNILQTIGTQFERLMLQTALQFTGGHKQEAAKRLGWGRNTLTRKLKELGMDKRW